MCPIHVPIHTLFCVLLVASEASDSHLKLTVTRIVPSNWVSKRYILVLFSDFLRIQEPPTDRPDRPTEEKKGYEILKAI